MEVTRVDQAAPYDAPGHFGMVALRLHGGPGSALKDATVGLSHFDPGGGASLSASAADRVYVVLEGEITVTVEGQPETLGPGDSCFIAAGENREVVNHSGGRTTMLVFTRTPR